MLLIKKHLIVIIGLLPCIVIGQTLQCCNTEKEVEEAISGYWKIKDLDSKTIYHYWVADGQGNVEDVVSGEKDGEYEIKERNHSFFYLQKENFGFALNYIYKYGNWTSNLNYLDATKMILITNGESTEYYKVSE